MGLLHSLLKFSIGIQASGKIHRTHRKCPPKLTYLYQKFDFIAISKWFRPVRESGGKRHKAVGSRQEPEVRGQKSVARKQQSEDIKDQTSD